VGRAMRHRGTEQQRAQENNNGSVSLSLCLGIFSAWAMALACPADGQVIRTTDGSGVGLGFIKDDPKKTREAIRRSCARRLDAAEKHLAAGKPVPAWQSLKSAKGVLVDTAHAKRWLKLAAQVNRSGQPIVKDADDAYERGEYAAARSAYRRAASGYAGLPVGKYARQKLRELEKDPAVRAARLEAQAKRMFALVEGALARQRKLLAAKAAKAAASGKRATSRATSRPAEKKSDLDILKTLDDEAFMDAVEQLERIVKTCRPAPTALKAAGWLEKINADPATKARIARLRVARKARQDFATAEAYRKGGMLAKAAKFYRKIVKTYPGSTAAFEAGKRLAAVETILKNR